MQRGGGVVWVRGKRSFYLSFVLLCVWKLSIPQIPPRILAWVFLSCRQLCSAPAPGSRCWLRLFSLHWRAFQVMKEHENTRKSKRKKDINPDHKPLILQKGTINGWTTAQEQVIKTIKPEADFFCASVFYMSFLSHLIPATKAFALTYPFLTPTYYLLDWLQRYLLFCVIVIKSKSFYGVFMEKRFMILLHSTYCTSTLSSPGFTICCTSKKLYFNF